MKRRGFLGAIAVTLVVGLAFVAWLLVPPRAYHGDFVPRTLPAEQRSRLDALSAVEAVRVYIESEDAHVRYHLCDETGRDAMRAPGARVAVERAWRVTIRRSEDRAAEIADDNMVERRSFDVEYVHITRDLLGRAGETRRRTVVVERRIDGGPWRVAEVDGRVAAGE